MQVVKRIIGGFFLLILFLWLFAPKQELYYLLEKTLKEQQDIIISNETVKDTWYGVKIADADIYVKGAKMVHIGELELNIFFVYNTLKVKEITTDEVVHKVAPKRIDEALVKYSVLNPLKITLNGLGSFGTLDGNVSLVERQVLIKLPISKDIKAFRKFLKKDETGVWKYETTY